jgi:acetyl esterase/lipase
MSAGSEQNNLTMSRRARFVRWITGWYLNLFDMDSLAVAKVRKRLDFFAGMVPTARGVQVKKDSVAGLYAEWLTPAGAPEDKLLLYWHGGAYVIGSCKSHRPFVSHIARQAGIRALLPEYRLAPEHPFPAAVEDSVNVYRALLRQGYEPANIIVGGDSAGGGLAVAMLLSLREAGDPLPGAMILLSPWLDLSGQGDSMITRAGRDPWFHAQHLAAITRYYCDEGELTNALASPVFADAAGLPQSLIQVGDDELLLSDSERFAENIRAGGGQVEIDVWPHMWHVWQMFIGLMPESRRAVEKLGTYIRKTIV